MTHRRPSRIALVRALYLNAALLGAILLVLLVRGSSPTIVPAAFAQNQPAIGGGAGVFIVPAQFAPNVFGCYLMDIDSQTICAYHYSPPDKKLRLVAARSYRYDRQLKQFNIDTPTPDEVRVLVEQERENSRVIDRPTEHAPVEPQK